MSLSWSGHGHIQHTVDHKGLHGAPGPSVKRAEGTTTLTTGPGVLDLIPLLFNISRATLSRYATSGNVSRKPCEYFGRFSARSGPFLKLYCSHTQLSRLMPLWQYPPTGERPSKAQCTKTTGEQFHESLSHPSQSLFDEITPLPEKNYPIPIFLMCMAVLHARCWYKPPFATSPIGSTGPLQKRHQWLHDALHRFCEFTLLGVLLSGTEQRC